MEPLAEQRAVITGGARGIGLGIASRLVATGVAVILWDVDEDESRKAVAHLGSNIGAVAVDVSNVSSVEAAARETLAQGGIDILINNAGIAGPSMATWEYPREAWQQVLDIDLTGVFLCCKAVVPDMLKRDYGRIVNIASIAGKEGNPNACAYSA